MKNLDCDDLSKDILNLEKNTTSQFSPNDFKNFAARKVVLFPFGQYDKTCLIIVFQHKQVFLNSLIFSKT